MNHMDLKPKKRDYNPSKIGNKGIYTKDREREKEEDLTIIRI